MTVAGLIFQLWNTNLVLSPYSAQGRSHGKDAWHLNSYNRFFILWTFSSHVCPLFTCNCNSWLPDISMEDTVQRSLDLTDRVQIYSCASGRFMFGFMLSADWEELLKTFYVLDLDVSGQSSPLLTDRVNCSGALKGREKRKPAHFTLMNTD